MKKYLSSLALIFVSAAMLTLASPGFDRGFLAWFALVPLFIIVEKKFLNPVKAGILFGLVYYFINISWLAVPLSRLGEAPLIVSWIITASFAIYLGLYYAVTLYVFSRTGSLTGVPLMFVLGEFLRGILFTGFPWLTLAQTQYRYPEILFVNSLGGEYLLSFLIVLGNLLVFRGIRQRGNLLFACGFFLPVALYLAGHAVPEQKADKTAEVRIIQTGIKQEDKWNPDLKDRIVSGVQLMLLESAKKDFDLVVMPETAYPLMVQDDPLVKLTLETLSEDTPILLGATRYAVEEGKRRYYNSAMLYKDGSAAVYDKVHLVPFGEYMPFGKVLKPLEKFFFAGGEDYSFGKSHGVFDSGEMRIAPMVCYEGAFFGQLDAQADAGANVIVIISNDSWFGFSNGRSQHLAVDVMRSAEFGLSMIRSAQSGISAFIDGRGRIISVLDVGEKGYLDHRVNLNPSVTVFHRYGYFWLFVLSAGYAAVFYRKRKKA
jgi:apolipoprotein N-acyltransferase